MEPDDLYTTRTCFYLGHYGLALEDAERVKFKVRNTPHLQTEREELICRSHLAQNLSVNASGSSPAIQMLLLLENSSHKSKDDVILEAQTLLHSPQAADSSSTQLYAAQLFMKYGMTREALKCVHLGTTMEHLAACVHIYIKLDRLDLADEHLQLMRQADEDATLTQLCHAVYCLACGSSRAEEALYAYQTLSEQYGPSPMLLNGMAVANLVMGEFVAAEGMVEEAIQAASEGGKKEQADALVNAVAIYQNLNKEDKVQESIDALKMGHADHPYVQNLLTVEAALQRVCAQYA